MHGDAANLLGPFVLFAKLMFVAFLMFWVRFTYPRLREDQLQAIAWKYLIPIGLLNIIATAIIKVAVTDGFQEPKLPGVIAGLGVTFRTMLKARSPCSTPTSGRIRPTRARGVIALKEENCTVCMLCGRSCPDWCIYIEGHKELATAASGRWPAA